MTLVRTFDTNAQEKGLGVRVRALLGFPQLIW